MVGVRSLLTSALAITAVTAQSQFKCSKTQKCPEEAPCCSLYGDCGVGAFCLGGCDPTQSFSMDSCVPNPVCDSKKFGFDKIENNNKYRGDYTKANWVSEGQVEPRDKGGVLLTMAPDTVGSLLGSTTYVWYGKITAKIRTSCGNGVVTAFILMSNVKDEIDYEFVGSNLNEAQTNYYCQGEIDYTKGDKMDVEGVNAQTHTYVIDWTQDEINWYVDGQLRRSVKRSDTYNEKLGRYDYPQTPARVMLSLWPGGKEGNAEGTVKWAGGKINWSHPTCMPQGYYYAAVEELTVECYDQPSGVKGSGSKAYKYADKKATEDTIELTDDIVILKSMYATGDDPEIDPDEKEKKDKPQTVPGGISAGSHSEDRDSNGGGDDNGGDNGDDSGSSGSSKDEGGFSQNSKSDTGASETGAASATVARGVLAAGAALLAVIV